MFIKNYVQICSALEKPAQAFCYKFLSQFELDEIVELKGSYADIIFVLHEIAQTKPLKQMSKPNYMVHFLKFLPIEFSEFYKSWYSSVKLRQKQ